MKIYTILQMGEFHTHHCEDYLVTAEAGKANILCAVMDGCSMGTDSYFAATLTGKVLRKIAKEFAFREFVEKTQWEVGELLQEVMRRLFIALRHCQDLMQLRREELLNTLLLGVIDTATRAGEFIGVGDGLIVVDGVFYEFEQDNRPDYLGYHLTEDFDVWWGMQGQRLSMKGMRDCSLVTDGIFTFKRFDAGEYESVRAGAVADRLLLDADDGVNENMLHARMMEIETGWGLRPTDDLGHRKAAGYLG